MISGGQNLEKIKKRSAKMSIKGIKKCHVLIVYIGKEEKNMIRESKKMLGIILVFAMLLTQLSFGAIAKADNTVQPSGENAPASVSMMYFAEMNDYPDALGQIEEINGMTGTAGGAVKWDYGFVVIEPVEGYTIQKVYSAVSMTAQDQKEYTLGTVSSVRANVTSLKDNIADALDTKDSTTPAIYLSRAEYNNLKMKQLFIECADANGKSSTMTLSWKTDTIQYGTLKTVSIGDRFSAFDYDGLKEYFEESELTSDNFDIYTGNINSTPIDAVTLESDGMYKAQKNGRYMFQLTSKKDGRTFEYQVEITQADGGLSDSDITVSENAKLDTMNSSMGMYNVMPADTSEFVLQDASVMVKLPEGATIDWTNTTYNNQVLKENETLTNNYEVDDWDQSKWPCESKVGHSVSDTGLQVFTFSNTYALEGHFALTIISNGISYLYTFQFWRNSTFGMNGVQTYYVTPYRKESILNYISFMGIVGEDKSQVKQEFLDNVTSGRYKIMVSGADVVFNKDGKFEGDVIFYHPADYMTIFDTKYKITAGGCQMDMRCKMNGVIKSGESYDITQYMNGYWSPDYQVELSGDDGFTYDETSHLLQAPENTSDQPLEQKVSVSSNGNIVAEFMVYDCSKETYDAQVASVVTNKVGTDETLVIDVNDADGTISKDVLNALGDGEDKSITLQNSQSEDKVDWTFDASAIDTTATKDIALSVDVEDTQADEKVEALVGDDADGLTVGFEDNGALPGEAEVRVYLSKEQMEKFDSADSQDGVAMYYLDPTTDQLVREQTDLQIMKDQNATEQYYIEMPVSHNSDFLLTTKKNLKAGESASTSTPTKQPEETSGPEQSNLPTATPTESIKPITSQNPLTSTIPTAIPSDSAKPTTTLTPSTSVSKSPVVKAPSVAKIKKVKATTGKKKVVLSWKKLTGIAGYQLQISSKKNFKGAKTIAVKKSVIKYVFKKANGKKMKGNYYVRIRAYKTYTNESGKKIKVYGKYVTVKAKIK